MTSNPARGCVKVPHPLLLPSLAPGQVGVHLEDVPDTCLPAARRADYLRSARSAPDLSQESSSPPGAACREQLEERAGELEDSYSAGRVTSGSCTDITW